jgi:hypothetical protein
MKKQSKAKAKPAPETAAGQTAAKVKADKAEKRTGRKAAAVADNATERELLREVVKGLGVIADRVESVRRTLWRMSEVRNYENKGGKGEPLPDAGKQKQAMIKLLGELYYPQWENLVQDIASGRIDTAPEYAELRALPDWAAFRASFNADGVKPKAADAGKPKAKGGKR